MKKIFKMMALALSLAIATVSTSNAAFPKDKQATEVTVSNTTNNEIAATEAPVTKKELKAELKKTTKKNAGSKSKIVAALLAFFLGGLGIHSFYMGNKKKGLIQLGVTVLGLLFTILGAAKTVSNVAGETAKVSGLVILGMIMLLGVSIWAFVDFIRILTGGLAPEEGFND